MTNRRWTWRAVAVILLAGAGMADEADSAVRGDAPPDTGATLVTRVAFYGNRHTRENILRRFLDIDSGDVYDTAVIAQAKARLRGTDLFERVEIFPAANDSATTLQVVLVERPYLTLSEIGGDFMDRYGKRADKFWQWGRVRLGLSYVNFRGCMEEVSVRLSLIEWRSLSAYWLKPLIGTRYYIQVGAGAFDNPSTNDPLRSQGVFGSLLVGRGLLTNARVYVSATPSWRNTDMLGASENVQYEDVMLHAGWTWDRRDDSFDPHRGFLISTGIRTNPTFPAEGPRRISDGALLARQYLQGEAQFRFYHRGFFARDLFAYRLRLSLRNRDGGLLNRVSAGGESTLRGYSSGSVSNGAKANDLFTGAVEYRFPIWSTPAFDILPGLGLPQKLGYDLHGFYWRLDGGVFFDGAYVWDEWSEPLEPAEGHQKAYAIGAALRIVLPTVRHTIAFDLSPVRYNYLTYLPEWAWAWNLYLDLNF